LILVDQEGITFGEIDCLKAIESVVHSDNSEGVQIGQDVVFYNEPGEIKANLEPHIRKALKVALMDFIREHHVNGITRESQILLKEIQNELLRFRVMVLEEDPLHLRKFYNFWGISLDEATLETFEEYHTAFKGHPKEASSVNHVNLNSAITQLSIQILSQVLEDVQERVSRLLLVDTETESDFREIINNGVFIYQGKNQEEAIRNFLSRDNSGLVPKGEVDIWTDFLSGKSLPAEPITWLGPKTHLIILFKISAEYLNESTSSTFPMELLASQPPWRIIIPLIQFRDGERMGYRDVFHSWGVLKKSLASKALYIHEFMSSYKGEY
jgi:hypothetical protein